MPWKGKVLVSCAIEVRHRKPGTKLDNRKDGRYAGRVRLAVVLDRSAESLCGFVESTVAPGSLIVTDDWSGYLTHGMLCFIQGQYAVRVRNGGMLGYVLDGNVAQAIRNVSSLIEKRHEELRMQPPGEMMQSSILPEDRRLRETRHSRSFKPENFVIHHIFARGRY